MNLNIVLADYLLVREEDGCIFLFNKKNDAVIKISSTLYSKLKTGKLRDTDDNRKIIDILLQNSMLDSKKENIVNIKSIQQTERIFYAPLTRLRSTVNPINVLWAITSRCNLKCIYCFPDVKSVQNSFISLSQEKLYQIADQIADAKVLQLLISGGEPLLEKNVWGIIDRLYKHNIKIGIVRQWNHN